MSELCTKCGQRPRQAHTYWCTDCIEAPAPGRPARPCPRCGPTVWLDLGGGVWHCRSCGFDPALPDGRPIRAELYDAPPVPPAPVPVCQVCGPTVWEPRPDGSTQCRLC